MSTVNLLTGDLGWGDTIQGASQQWSDGSDATWATAQRYSNGVNSNAGLMLDQFTGDVTQVTGFQITVRCAVTAPAGAATTMPLTFGLFPSDAAYPSPKPNGYWTVNTDGQTYDYSTTLTDATLATAVAAEQVEFDIGFHVHDFGGTDYGSTPLTGTYLATIYEASVLVVLAPPEMNGGLIDSRRRFRP